MTDELTVVLDSNEVSNDFTLVDYYKDHDDITDWKVEDMGYGDILFPESSLVIERKTPNDFAGSMVEGRLKDQIKKMKDVTDNVYVLVEGDMSDFDRLPNTRVKSASLRGYSASIMARRGVPIVFCSNQDNLRDISVRIARKYIEDETTNFTNISSVDPKEDATKRVFGCIPGVGASMADTLYKEFRSVENLQRTDDLDLSDIDGLGEKTIENIREVLGYIQ